MLWGLCKVIQGLCRGRGTKEGNGTSNASWHSESSFKGSRYQKDDRRSFRLTGSGVTVGVCIRRVIPKGCLYGGNLILYGEIYRYFRV